MTTEEAAKLATVIAEVDGACVVCVSNATDRLIELFPEHDWTALVTQAAGREADWLASANR